MCTVVLLRRPGHAWPLVLAANRDEMADRPWKAPARHWPDRREVVAGLDVLAGGTWLGVNDEGVVAVVLNRRGSLGPKAGRRSRGELPLEALDHADALSAAQALADIDPAAYRSFNLIVADAAEAYWIVSRDDGPADRPPPPVGVHALPPGLTMLTAGDRNDASSPRVCAYLPRFAAAQAPDPAAGDWDAWAALMAGRETEAGPEGAMTILTKGGFGTVCSSLVAIGRRAGNGYERRWLFAAGRPGEAPFLPVEF